MLVFSPCVTFFHPPRSHTFNHLHTSSTVITTTYLCLPTLQVQSTRQKREKSHIDRQTSTSQNHLTVPPPNHNPNNNNNNACSSKVLSPRLCRLHGLRPNLHHRRRLERRRRRRRRPHPLATATRTSPIRAVRRHAGAEREQVRENRNTGVSCLCFSPRKPPPPKKRGALFDCSSSSSSFLKNLSCRYLC